MRRHPTALRLYPAGGVDAGVVAVVLEPGGNHLTVRAGHHLGATGRAVNQARGARVVDLYRRRQVLQAVVKRLRCGACCKP